MPYLRHLVRHPSHVALVGLLATAAAFSWSLMGVVVAVLVEAAALVVMPRLPTVRRWVDQRERVAEALRAAAQRADALSRLDPAHRSQFMRLERLVDVIRERVHHDFGISRMLAAYVGGGIAFASARARWTTDRGALAGQVSALEHASEQSGSPSVSAVARERLHVTRLRVDRCDRSRDDLELLHAKLGLLADMIELVYDNVTVPVQSRAVERTVEESVAGIEEAAQVTEELVAALHGDGVPDSRVFEP